MNDGIHVGDFFHAGKLPDGIVDIEAVHTWEQARSTANHLFKQDTGLHATHEDEVHDGWDVNARRQKVNGNDDIREFFVFKLPDMLFFMTVMARNFHDGIRRQRLISLGKGLLQQVYNHIGMRIAGSKDKRLAQFPIQRVKPFRQDMTDDTIEGFCHYLRIESIDIKIHVVR